MDNLPMDQQTPWEVQREAEIVKLRADLEHAKVDRDCCCAGTEELRKKLEVTNLQIGEKDRAIALLSERIRGLLPHRGGTMPCSGPGCNFCDDEEAVVDKPIDPTKDCGCLNAMATVHRVGCPMFHPGPSENSVG
jgi:hypothetical protein